MKAHNNLGLIRERQRRYEEALIHWRSALNDPAIRTQVHNNMGAMLLDIKKVDEAIRHFELAIDLDSKFNEARRNLELALKIKEQIKLKGIKDF